VAHAAKLIPFLPALTMPDASHASSPKPKSWQSILMMVDFPSGCFHCRFWMHAHFWVKTGPAPFMKHAQEFAGYWSRVTPNARKRANTKGIRLSNQTTVWQNEIPRRLK
jgi:hypothetical protein